MMERMRFNIRVEETSEIFLSQTMSLCIRTMSALCLLNFPYLAIAHFNVLLNYYDTVSKPLSYCSSYESKNYCSIKVCFNRKEGPSEVTEKGRGRRGSNKLGC